MNLRDDQLQTLRHMLGIDEPWDRDPKPYRDYFCANPGDKEMAELLEAGAVVLYSREGRYEWFRCTDDGRAAAVASHRKIRYSKSKRVYGKFLEISDCYSDLTFKQFLTDPEFSDVRRRA